YTYETLGQFLCFYFVYYHDEWLYWTIFITEKSISWRSKVGISRLEESAYKHELSCWSYFMHIPKRIV
ncbi:MAG: hypothetical protein KAG06_06975, partial [Methylococcales bacterium]|nr:hypothetical protein [Methylococcales bacterium]